MPDFIRLQRRIAADTKDWGNGEDRVKHVAELRNRSTAIYAIANQIKWLVETYGVVDAEQGNASVQIGDDLRVVVWKPEGREGPQMFVVYEGGYTVLSGYLDHGKPRSPATHYDAAQVLIQTWHRGPWQRRLFEDTPDDPEEPLGTPVSPAPPKGLRLVHSSDE